MEETRASRLSSTSYARVENAETGGKDMQVYRTGTNPRGQRDQGLCQTQWFSEAGGRVYEGRRDMQLWRKGETRPHQAEDLDFI